MILITTKTIEKVDILLLKDVDDLINQQQCKIYTQEFENRCERPND